MREFGLTYGTCMTLLRRRDVKINGKRISKCASVRAGDTVIVYVPETKKQALPIVYQDENVVVIDKPAGVDVVQATHLLGKLGARAVHRLDTNTTGLMIFARTDEAEQELLQCFRLGKVNKKYSAVVFGVPSVQHALLNDYLVKDADRGVVKILSQRARGALTVITEFDKIKSDGEITLLEVTLHTGRTHQIRAHLAYHGLPVLGDTKYGDFEANRRYGKKKQMLKCVYLAFQTGGVLQYLSEKQFVLPALTILG